VYSHFSATDWVTPFGLMFIGAIFTAWVFARRNAATTSVGPSHVDLIMPITIIVGVTGGVLLAWLMPLDHQLAGQAMNHGLRLRLFGMLGSGAIGVFIYCRIAGLSFRRVLDIFALPTLAGVAVHRVGCHFAGCCWGDVVQRVDAGALSVQIHTTSLLDSFVRGIQYPPGSLPFEQHLALGLIGSDAAASLPVHPVQLYEVGLLLVLVAVLSRVPWRELPRGTLAVLAVVGYALGRFFIGYLRADGSVLIGNLTVTQVQCLLLLGSALLLPRFRRGVVS
jgi:prolipoprotein diacylglyceryltransferase